MSEVRVLKVGHIPTNYYEGSCWRCKSLLSTEEQSVYSWHFINCPVCNAETKLDTPKPKREKTLFGEIFGYGNENEGY